jgi:hypothetical protein
MKKHKLLLIVSIALLSGCAMLQGTIKNKTVTEYPDGRVVKSKTTAKLPTYPAGYSIYTNAAGEYLELPSSQNEATIERVRQDGRNSRLLYFGAMLLVVIGGLAFALPNDLVDNRDASIILICGLLSFGAIRYIQAAEPIMKYVVPIAIIGGGGWVGYTYFKRKKDKDSKPPTT